MVVAKTTFFAYSGNGAYSKPEKIYKKMNQRRREKDQREIKKQK